MKRLIKLLFGFNIASLTHLVPWEPKQFRRACRRAFDAATRKWIPIPEIDFNEVIGDRKPVIQLSVMRYENGMLPSNEVMILLSILVAEAPKVVLEIGTYMGHTTRQIAENLKTSTIHTVDLPEDFSAQDASPGNIPKDDPHLIMRRVVGREFKGQPCASRIKQHFADTANWNFHESGQPTCFFIDGAHTYEYCKNDSEKCFELCEGKGIFIWHDCNESHPGVEKLISEWVGQDRDVKRISGTALAYWKTI